MNMNRFSAGRNYFSFISVFVLTFVFVLTASGAAHAGVFKAFGPKTFLRGTGKPATETVSFSVKNPNTIYTVHVYNGGMNSKFSRVSSAVVKINGAIVFGPDDFNQQTGTLQRPVAIVSSNTLEVELRSAPGSGLTIVLEGTDDVPPVVTISSPADGIFFNSQSITVTGSASDSISDVSSLSINGAVVPLRNDTFSTPVSLTEGANSITVVATDAAGNTAQSTVTVTLDTTAPQLSVAMPLNQSVLNTDTVAVAGTVTDTGSGIQAVSVNGTAASVAGTAYMAPALPLTEGANTITTTAQDNAGNTASSTITVYRDTTAPSVTITSPEDGSTVTADSVIVTGTVNDPSAVVRVNGVLAQVTNNTFTATVPLAPGANTITITVTDPAGNAGTATISVTYTALLGVPPDPAVVAPPLDDAVATTLASATAFLYTGENPIQTGVALGTIEPRRIAVLRGQVRDKDGKGLPGVNITILEHPEYGSTKTRMDGMFDMAVNGGGQLIVKYEREGFIPVQRSIDAPWQDYAWLADAVMIPFDEKVTTVDLSSQISIQVAQGSAVTDKDGTRTATLLFRQGTNALMWLPGGSYVSLDTLNVRATEFTVGENGEKAMPAALPPTSAYTYAVEFSVDEAVAAGATSVTFSRPVISYTDNFLGFPVGSAVPAGYYDRQMGVWVPMDDGKVIQILNVDNGIAAIGMDGSGIAASAAALSSMGITDDERRTLASLYQPGASLWRVSISHFSPVDYNWPWAYTAPEGARSANAPDPYARGILANPCLQPGSIIECENLTLGETIPVTGTPFTLNYRSDRAPGRKAAYSLEIPLSKDGALPASLQRISVIVEVAGRRFNYVGPFRDMNLTFNWDGQDAYGRTVQGVQPVTINIGYVYDAVFLPVSAALQLRSFGRPVTIGYGPRPTRIQVVWWQQKRTVIGAMDSRGLGLGGWTLDIQHAYDAQAQVLHMGNGRRRSAADIGKVISTVAGNGTMGGGGDGGPAVNAQLSPIAGITFDDKGNLYITDSYNNRIRKVGTDGTISTRANVLYANGTAVDSQGNLYFASRNRNQVLKIYPDKDYGIPVAGDGAQFNGQDPGSWFRGDEGPATSAPLWDPHDVAVDDQGNLYIAEAASERIRKVGPDGIITTVAGCGIWCMGRAEGGPAVSARLRRPVAVAVDNQGNLYIAENYNHVVRKVGPDGIITTIAGRGTPGYSGDGGPGVNAQLNYPSDVAVDSRGNVYIADSNNYRIRKVTPDGTITTVAGAGISTTGWARGDGGLAVNALLGNNNFGPLFVALDPQDNLYISDHFRVRKVSSTMPEFTAQDFVVPSEDGKELYSFDNRGRHLKTTDAVTSVVLYTFTYGQHGYLTAVTDHDGNVTTIERDSMGNPTAIIAPGSQRTQVAVDANGYLSAVTNPAGEATSLVHTPDGLLTTFTTPEGKEHTFTYDTQGLLIKDEDPAGGYKTLSRTIDGNDYTVSLTTARGRTTGYGVENTDTGTRRTITNPAGLQTVTVIDQNGTTVTTMPDGTTTTETQTPDPRFGMQAPVRGTTIKTPGGLTATTTMSRSVSLTDPRNPLSLTSMTEWSTVNGKTYTSAYNKSAKTITTTTPAGRTRTAKLDAKGRIIEEQIPGLDPVSYVYDEKGRLTTITRGGRITTINYNSQNQISTITDPLARTAGFAYDLAGRSTQQTLPGGRTIGYGFDHDGNMTSLTPPGRPEHGFTYTSVDLLQDYLPPSIGAGTASTTYGYDLDKNLTQINRPDGQNVSFDYDNAGRLSTLTTQEGTASYSYDAASGHLSSITHSGKTLSYAYDGSLLTGTEWTGAVSGSVGFSYNNDLRITSETVNDANGVSYAYDNDGLLTGAGSLTLTRNTQNGLLTGTTLGAVGTGYAYNTLGEVNQTSATISGSTFFNEQYVRDNMGRITQKTETIGGVTDIYAYGYDTAGRLMTVTKNGIAAGSYTHDANGNRISYTNSSETAIGSYDNQDRLIAYGGNMYTYTANGDMVSKTADGQTTAYNYDAQGNLLSATVADNTVIEYVIDGQNRRIGKKINGALVQGFLYQNQLRPVAELDGAGNVVSRFVYATKANMPDYMIKGGSTYRIVTDHLGSPRLVVDATTGTVAQRMDYDEFGNVTQDTNPGFQPFGFAGGLHDQHTKLTRFGARDYDAEMGRWTAKDPIRFAGGDTNLYGYVGNNPVNWIDPWGLTTVQVGVTVNIQAGPINFTGTVGLAVDGHGNLGPYVTGGGGPGAGAHVSGGITVAGSNAENINDLGGPFVYGSGGAGFGPDISGDFFTGDSPDGPVAGGGFTIGVGGGAGGSTGVTWTNVWGPDSNPHPNPGPSPNLVPCH
jgi:RHS repeat-associated protein